MKLKTTYAKYPFTLSHVLPMAMNVRANFPTKHIVPSKLDEISLSNSAHYSEGEVEVEVKLRV
jgi:hypothetical protein